MDAVFADTEIRFASYEFPGATVYPSGAIGLAEIRDVDPRATPPEVRTVRGETLFVLAAQRSELDDFATRHGIPVRRRPDVWADLLEPFLDTSFDPDDVRATLDRLRRAGVSPAEVDEIRGRVERAMLAYNIDSMLWEWVHLGLYDLLSAGIGTLVSSAVRETVGDPAGLYAWAMEIADRPGDASS
ncbi:hypothetical protein [Nocardia sp. NPDC060259]|uniref:hypothetical protein n=1 Tax=Nocardia sp. NPDC060259 TaxID=3347088 RepID=UPI003660A0CD